MSSHGEISDSLLKELRLCNGLWDDESPQVNKKHKFTGCKSFREKKLYEGDILDSELFKAVIMWVVDGWELHIIPKDGSMEHGGGLACYLESFDMKKVGSIYE